MQNQIIFLWSYVQWHTNKLSLSISKENLSFENLSVTLKNQGLLSKIYVSIPVKIYSNF